jgi:hypothetical protein
MAIKAGSIVTVAGRTVIQRLQSAGLTNVTIPIDTVREIGNDNVVDQVPMEPDFTWSMEALAVDCELEAIFHGEVSTGALPTQAAGYADAPGTEYPFGTCQSMNVLSPWKDPQSYSSGNVIAGYIIPGYFPSKLSYKFGVTENASVMAELRGGSYYAGAFAPTEDVFAGTGSQTAFVTAEPAVQYRKGGVGGTLFKNVFGVLVNGVMQNEGEDFTVTGGGVAGSNTVATVTFLVAPPSGAQVRVAYFTTNAHAFPSSVLASSLVLPGAVRGRDICLSLASGGAMTWQKVYGVQTVTLDASFDLTIERELCNDEFTGFTVNGTNTTGAITLHAKDAPTFYRVLMQLTGINSEQEVIGWLNINPLRLKIEIMDPAHAGTVLKTLYCADATFDVPATPARVNAVVDFSLSWRSLQGTYSAFKGAAAV